MEMVSRYIKCDSNWQLTFWMQLDSIENSHIHFLLISDKIIDRCQIRDGSTFWLHMDLCLIFRQMLDIFSSTHLYFIFPPPAIKALNLIIMLSATLQLPLIDAFSRCEEDDRGESEEDFRRRSMDKIAAAAHYEMPPRKTGVVVKFSQQKVSKSLHWTILQYNFFMRDMALFAPITIMSAHVSFPIFLFTAHQSCLQTRCQTFVWDKKRSMMSRLIPELESKLLKSYMYISFVSNIKVFLQVCSFQSDSFE